MKRFLCFMTIGIIIFGVSVPGYSWNFNPFYRSSVLSYNPYNPLRWIYSPYRHHTMRSYAIQTPKPKAKEKPAKPSKNIFLYISKISFFYFIILIFVIFQSHFMFLSIYRANNYGRMGSILCSSR